MKVEIEMLINSATNINELNTVIAAGLVCKNLDELRQCSKSINSKALFFYFGGSHCAIHEILEDGCPSNNRLLFIH